MPSLPDPRIVDTPAGLVAIIDDFETAVEEEFVAWIGEPEHPTPPPPQAGSAPAGWTVAAHRPQPGRAGDPSTGLFLYKAAGGWVIVRRQQFGDDAASVSLQWYRPTLASLHAYLSQTGTRPTDGQDVAWIERLLLPMYDPSDEDEAAHQTLVALGAPMRVLPRAAHHYDGEV